LPTAAPTLAPAWFVGSGTSESCDTTCAAQGRICSDDTLYSKAVECDSEQEINALRRVLYGSNCTSYRSLSNPAAPLMNANGACFYKEPDVGSNFFSCSQASSWGIRFCVCDSSASSDAVVSVAASSEAVVSVAAMSSESVLALVTIACVFAVLVGSYVLVGVCSRRSNVAKRAIEASASAGAGGNKTEASAAPCAVAGEPPKTTSELRTADAHDPLVLGKEPPSHITTTEEAPMCGCSG
jgi:hypothetical protein